VLKAEGYIRGYSQTEFGNGRSEIEIELKYHRRRRSSAKSRVSKPGRRVYVFGGVDAARGQRPRHRHPFDAEGCDGRPRSREQNVGGEVLCKVF
jgi:small subunit ribosomal protein S8